METALCVLGWVVRSPEAPSLAAMRPPFRTPGHEPPKQQRADSEPDEVQEEDLQVEGQQRRRDDQGDDPGHYYLMARRSKRALRRLRKKKNRERDRRNGRMPFRPHGWFGKRSRSGGRQQSPGHKAATLEIRRRKPRSGWIPVVAVVALAVAAVALPQPALADDHWRDEIDFEVTEPVPGRRIFVEGLTVSGDRAAVTLRAATALDIRVRAYGGPEGSWLRFWGSATLGEGERIDYSLPLNGPKPSFTVSWEDTLGQAGAVTVKPEQIPYPLPEVEGELCDLSMTSLGWTPGVVTGVIESECAVVVEEAVELETVAGHVGVTETALMDAGVTAITGTVAAATGASHAGVPFVPNGETRFRLVVPAGEAVHAVTVDVDLEAALRIPIPPLTHLTHHPERKERRTETVSLWRPGTSQTVSETVTFTNPDGTTEERVLSATLSIPGRTIHRDVTLTIVHPEHVKAEVVDRSPIAGTREESLTLESAVGSDDPFAALVLPEPEPEDPPAEQEPADGLRRWFELLGWEWPW